MQAASPAAAKRRLRQRARLLVQGIDAAPAAEQTETGFDAGRAAPRVQADRQSAVIVVVRPLSAQGQKRKGSLRADVFRFTPEAKDARDDVQPGCESSNINLLATILHHFCNGMKGGYNGDKDNLSGRN